MSATDLEVLLKQSKGALQTAEADARATGEKAEAAWNHVRQAKAKSKQLKKALRAAKKAARQAEKEAKAARKALKKAQEKAAKVEKALRKHLTKGADKKPAKPTPALGTKTSQSLPKLARAAKPPPKRSAASKPKAPPKALLPDAAAHGAEPELTSGTLPSTASFDPTAT